MHTAVIAIRAQNSKIDQVVQFFLHQPRRASNLLRDCRRIVIQRRMLTKIDQQIPTRKIGRVSFDERKQLDVDFLG